METEVEQEQNKISDTSTVTARAFLAKFPAISNHHNAIIWVSGWEWIHGHFGQRPRWNIDFRKKFRRERKILQ